MINEYNNNIHLITNTADDISVFNALSDNSGFRVIDFLLYKTTIPKLVNTKKK